MSTILAKCPFRDLDWVFQRATRLVDFQELPPSRRQDGDAAFGWIRKTAEYLRFMRENPQEIYEIANRFGEIHWAFMINSNPAQAFRRTQVELMILAGLSDEEIEQKSRRLYTPELVKTYEALFFDIRRLLDSPVAVTSYLHQNLPEDGRTTAGRLWRLMAYFRGYDYAACFMNRFASVDKATPSNVAAAVVEDAINSLKNQAFMAVQLASTYGQGATEMVSNFIKNRDVETRENLNDTSTDQLAEALEVLERTVAKSVLIGDYDPATGQKLTTQKSRLENTAVEPQLSAIIRPNVMRRLESAAYPNMLLPAPAVT